MYWSYSAFFGTLKEKNDEVPEVQKHGSDEFQDIRDAISALCSDFPDEYHRKIDEARGYPEAFVDALTKAGWMAALIPEEYGGRGLA